jgi:hypothetical protein
MRECQVDHPAAIGGGGGQGLGWMLPKTPRVVEHGGDAPGVAALLRTVPDKGVAAVLLTNGGTPGPLLDDLIDPLLRDLADIEPTPKLPTPRADLRVAEPWRYTGCYQTHQTRYEVSADEDGLLWAAMSERHEALTMTKAAGLPLEPEGYELRQVDRDVFVLIDPSGTTVHAAEFLGSEDAGRATYLHTGRAAPRTD